MNSYYEATQYDLHVVQLQVPETSVTNCTLAFLDHVNRQEHQSQRRILIHGLTFMEKMVKSHATLFQQNVTAETAWF